MSVAQLKSGSIGQVATPSPINSSHLQVLAQQIHTSHNPLVNQYGGQAIAAIPQAAGYQQVYYHYNGAVTNSNIAPSAPPLAVPSPMQLPSLPDGVKAVKGGFVKDLRKELVPGLHIIYQWKNGYLRGVVGKIGSDKYIVHHSDSNYSHTVTETDSTETYGMPYSFAGDLDTGDVWVWFLGGKGLKKKTKKKPIKLDFSGMVLPQEVCDSIQSILTTFSDGNKELLFERWGLNKTLEKGKGMAMLFYGVPGTGKTKCAEIIAKELGLNLKSIDMAMIWSSEPGEAERVIKGAFEEAAKKGDQLLLFDECEVLVANRNGAGQILAAQTNALLTSLERYEGVSIFTTNRTPQLDPAFDRRLQLKVEFPAPDFQTRLKIWKTLVPKKMPLGECVNFNNLAKSTLTGGYIKNVILNAARRAILAKSRKVLMEHFEKSLTDELNGMAAFAECDETPRLMGPGVKAGIKADMKNSIEIKERLGIENKETSSGWGS